MKTSTLIVIGAVAVGFWYYYSHRPIVVGAAGDAGASSPTGDSSSVPVSSPGPISDPENPTLTGFTTGSKNPLRADPSPIFSARRSRRNSIIAY